MQERGMLSVTQVNEYLKMLLDGDRVLSNIFVRGEISNFKLYSSGHAYFTLKDEGAQLKAVMFRSYASRLPFLPSDGMRVIVHGRISVYETSGQYQLYADEMQPDGAGSLALQFEQIKRRLASEGLFDEERKRPLPVMANRIGVITSPSGAAVRDIINILGRRFPLSEMILYPSQVQGSEAPMQLMAGLEFFAVTKMVDVIIIGRGGGSAEDLWAFNNEELARMIAASPIPVISAVGHESDFTICDFVADRRAPTPSAAAELAVPEKGELLRQLRSYTERMGSLTEQRIAQEKRLLRQLAQSRVLQSPERLLDPFQMQLSEAETGLERTMTQYFAQLRNRIGTDTEKLEALSPLSVLARGYAAVKRDDRAVLRAESLDVGDEIEIHFTDGSVSAVVRGKE